MNAWLIMSGMKTEYQLHDVSTENYNLRTEIAAHPFLTGMGAHHLDLLAHYAKQIHFNAGDVIFRAGESANGFYLVQTGMVAVEGSVRDGEPIASDIVHAGEALGWSWLFPPYRWHFDARAIEPSTLIFFDGEILRQHYNEDLTLAHDLFKRMSEVMVHRLQRTRRKLIEVMHKSQLTQ